MTSLKTYSTSRILIATGLLVSLLMSPVLFPATPIYAATFTVNSTLDRTDISPGDGVCRTATAGQCTLRAAIQEANALPGADIINLPAGVYELQLSGVNQDLDTTNDFDIRAPVTIMGAGASATYIDGGVPGIGAQPNARGIDRLLEIHPNTGNVTIRDLTLREGYTSGDGAVILHQQNGCVTHRRAFLHRCAALPGHGPPARG
ncbi:MAG: CSLREA domain-containing protein [Anaerolineae bacterium]|nr:CSLREA domain-containing protein [Anaerolineae bacterium]